MQASQRARELDHRYHRHPHQPPHNHSSGSHGRQRGHASQISISDESHHVTDAIGSMYGDDPDSPQRPERRPKPGRPLSFLPNPMGDSIQSANAYDHFDSHRPPAIRTRSLEKSSKREWDTASPTESHGGQRSIQGSRGLLNGQGASSPGSGPVSPTLNRSPSETAQQSFPMTDLNSQAAVAQELSNLQAIRRMSMDVHASDPDLPGFSTAWNMPTQAPDHDAEEDDPAKMFWVPASVHPELAPKAFETFIQDRVRTIKRSSLSSEALISSASSSGASSGLQRKKSMLSRQVNDARDYHDGAERLERKRSSLHHSELNRVSLQELEELAHDPSGMVQRLSKDGSKESLDAFPEGGEGQGMPILPPKPPGQTLKRSTRTTYRRGSQRKNERIVKTRVPGRGMNEVDAEDVPPVPSLSKGDDVPQLPALPSTETSLIDGLGGLTRVQTEPTSAKHRAVENFSRPGRKTNTPPLSSAEFGKDEQREPFGDRSVSPEERRNSPSPEHQHVYPPRGSSTARSPPKQPLSIPQIVETPPPPQQDLGARPQSLPDMQRTERLPSKNQAQSKHLPRQGGAQQVRPGLNQAHNMQQPGQQQQQQQQRVPQVQQPSQKKALDHVVGDPRQNTRTDSLSIIPTFADEKVPGKKGKDKDKKDDGSRKSSWKWFGGGSGAEKGVEEDEPVKKGKAKTLQKPNERGSQHDDTRMDVLQSAIDGTKPRESLVLDRSSIAVEQQSKGSSSSRKASSDSKKEKEKDTGLFSSLFGGGKKKGSSADKDGYLSGKRSHHSSSSLRGLSPDPPARRLQPDVDFNWTRFSILEERAIYRMAHIKLANPRRELYSQVLLSNFMYSYLAKVQQMHPQVQIPQSAAQRKEEARRKKAEKEQKEREREREATPDEFRDYQKWTEHQQRDQSHPSTGYTNNNNNPTGNSTTHTLLAVGPSSRASSASNHTQNPAAAAANHDDEDDWSAVTQAQHHQHQQQQQQQFQQFQQFQQQNGSANVYHHQQTYQQQLQLQQQQQQQQQYAMHAQNSGAGAGVGAGAGGAAGREWEYSRSPERKKGGWEY